MSRRRAPRPPRRHADLDWTGSRGGAVLRATLAGVATLLVRRVEVRASVQGGWWLAQVRAVDATQTLLHEQLWAHADAGVRAAERAALLARRLQRAILGDPLAEILAACEREDWRRVPLALLVSAAATRADPVAAAWRVSRSPTLMVRLAGHAVDAAGTTVLGSPPWAAMPHLNGLCAPQLAGRLLVGAAGARRLRAVVPRVTLDDLARGCVRAA